MFIGVVVIQKIKDFINTSLLFVYLKKRMKRDIQSIYEEDDKKFDLISYIPREISSIIFTFLRKKKDIRELRHICKSWNEKLEFWLKEHGCIILSDLDKGRIGLNFYHRIFPKTIMMKFKDEFDMDVYLMQAKNIAHLEIEGGYDVRILNSLTHVTSLKILHSEYIQKESLQKFTNLSTLNMVIRQPFIDFEMKSITSLSLRGNGFESQSLKYFPNLKSLKLIDLEQYDIYKIKHELCSIETLILDGVFVNPEIDDVSFDDITFDKLKVLKANKFRCLFLEAAIAKSNLEQLIVDYHGKYEFLYTFKPMSNLKVIKIYCKSLSILVGDVKEFSKSLYSCKNLNCFILKEEYTIKIDYESDPHPEQKRKEAFKEIKETWNLLISMSNIRFAQSKSNVLNYKFVNGFCSNFGFLDQ